MAIMHLMKRLFGQLLKDERGQSTTEYILILSVVVMIAIKFKGVFQGQLSSMLTKLGGNLSTAMDETAP